MKEQTKLRIPYEFQRGWELLYETTTFCELLQISQNRAWQQAIIKRNASNIQ